MVNSRSLRILVTDTNHHVRNFLKRELEKEGHRVTCVKNGLEAFNFIREPGDLDLVILDPELLCPYGRSLVFRVLQHRTPVPVIIHAFDDFLADLPSSHQAHIVEKNASSIEPLRATIRACFEAGAGRGGESCLHPGPV